MAHPATQRLNYLHDTDNIRGVSDSGSREELYGAIEVQGAVLTRNFELLRRRAPEPPEVDRAGYLILRTLDRLGSSSIGALADALGLDPSTAGRQVGVLEHDGLVERVCDPHDRRRMIVGMTAEGSRRMVETGRRRTRRTEGLLGDWPEEDLAALAEMFRRYNEAVAAHYLGPDGGSG